MRITVCVNHMWRSNKEASVHGVGPSAEHVDHVQ
jgi:hypothetical protein